MNENKKQRKVFTHVYTGSVVTNDIHLINIDDFDAVHEAIARVNPEMAENHKREHYRPIATFYATNLWDNGIVYLPFDEDGVRVKTANKFLVRANGDCVYVGNNDSECPNCNSDSIACKCEDCGFEW